MLPRRKRSASQQGKRRQTGRSKKKWTLDVEAVASEVIPEVASRLGLDYLGLTERELRDVIEPIISSIAEARSTKPSVESLVKRIVAGKQMLYKAIAAKLLEREELTVDQLEFIVANAPELAGRAAPKLYRIAKAAGADHIIDTLRFLWERYGKPTPVRCPYCGFRAVTPALECIVCGRSVEEEDLKRAIGFEDLLRRFAETADPALVEEVIRRGYVLLDDEIKPPSLRSTTPLAVEIYLTRRERELLRSLLSEKSSR